MKMSELIASYGDDKVEFQNLDQCATAFNTKKGTTLITFGTEEIFTLDGTQRLGLVVWLDRERVQEIVAASNARAKGGG